MTQSGLVIAHHNSMQDARHNVTSLVTSFPVAQQLERPTGVQKVMGSIPVGDSDVFFFPTLVTY